MPCNPESIAIGYALRKGSQIAPITSFFPKEMLVEALPNAITFEKFPDLHKQVMAFFSLATGGMPVILKNSMRCCAACLKFRFRKAWVMKMSSALPLWNSGRP